MTLARRETRGSSPPATRTSRARGGRTRDFAARRRVARSWLVLPTTCLGIAGCLVTSTTQFAEPELRGPFIVSADPPSFKVIPISNADVAAGRPVTLTLTVRSDDAGQVLQTILFQDYRGFSGETGVDGKRVTFAFANPSTFDDPRDISVSYTPVPPIADGCHSITAIVTHGYDTQHEQLTQAAALQTWWISVGEPGAAPLDCYGVVEPPPASDAGDEGG